MALGQAWPWGYPWPGGSCGLRGHPWPGGSRG